MQQSVGIAGTLATAALAGLVKLAFSAFQKYLETKKWKREYERSEPAAQAPPPPVFAPMPTDDKLPTAPAPPPPEDPVEQRRQQVQKLLLDAELSEAQLAMRRLRKSLDDMTHELAQAKAEVVISHSQLEEAEAAGRGWRERFEASQQELQRALDDNQRLREENRRILQEGRPNGSRYSPDPAHSDERPFGRVPSTGRMAAPPPVPPSRKDR